MRHRCADARPYPRPELFLRQGRSLYAPLLGLPPLRELQMMDSWDQQDLQRLSQLEQLTLNLGAQRTNIKFVLPQLGKVL